MCFVAVAILGRVAYIKLNPNDQKTKESVFITGSVLKFSSLRENNAFVDKLKHIRIV